MQCGPVPPERNTMNEEYPFEGMPETVFELKRNFTTKSSRIKFSKKKSRMPMQRRWRCN